MSQHRIGGTRAVVSQIFGRRQRGRPPDGDDRLTQMNWIPRYAIKSVADRGEQCLCIVRF
jgi:hypothetical protein